MTIYDRRLCFVEGNRAFFTDNFDHQWGDDWNDAPYEHNAGWPYENREDGDSCPNCGNITHIFFDGPYYTPCGDHINSPYTVEQINAGGPDAPPWVTIDPYEDDDVVRFYAGTTLADFIKGVQAAGGTVFMELNDLGPPTLSV